MYICAQLVEGVCTQWVEYNSLFLLPEGAGAKIGGALFMCTVVAWGAKRLALILLNR